MRCANCRFQNSTDSLFCQECGAALKKICAECRETNSRGAKFCRKCGMSFAPLAVGVGAEPSAYTASGLPAEAERRQLTVMFCDLAGSTALSERLDLEEFREVIRAYQQTCAEVIADLGGHVAQYLGDGLLVYFGYPFAREDDAQRAVRAGLGIIAAVGRLSVTGSEQPLQVRVGIHTGSVVVDEIGDETRHQRLALGGAPNIAARLQSMASPNTLLVSADTYRVIEGYFSCEDIGFHSLKGISAPIRVYCVSTQSGVRSRFELAVRAGLTPLVGRQNELEFLCSRWEMVKAGQGQVVSLSGEAGIGKSRLLQALSQRLSAETYVRLESSCSPYYENSALHPVIESLQELLGLRGDFSPEEKLARLERSLSDDRFVQADTLALLASLLSLPHPPSLPALTLTPQRQRQRTLDTLVAWLLEEAERQPLCLVIEDLHWADPSTLEFLDLLIRQVRTARIYVLLTFRTEFLSRWGGRSLSSHLALDRLQRGQVEEMVDGVTKGRGLPPDVVRQIREKTDGVPLFVEELTKMLIESGCLTEKDGHYELSQPLPAQSIPATLHDSLMARLDQLAPYREVAQLGATLGREFTYELIRAVSRLDDTTLDEGLEELVGAELLYKQGLHPQARYVFKHALIQDAAYESLLRSKRKRFHRRAAEVLEERFSDTVEAKPELVAHHYTAADLVERAIPYWQRAGHRALARSAYVEAEKHLSKGLELLSRLPEGRDRDERELALRSGLGVALVTTKGYSPAEVAENYSRAQRIGEGREDLRQIVPMFYGLWAYHLLRDHHEASFAIVDRLEQLARSPQEIFIATTTRGVTTYWRGNFPEADRYLEAAMELYDPDYPRSLAESFSADVALLPHCYRIWCLFHLGRVDRAKRLCGQVNELAAQLSSPYALATVLHYEAQLTLHLGEPERTLEVSEKLVSLSSEQQFALFRATGTGAHGWALAQRGNLEKGMKELQECIAFFDRTGAMIGRAFWLSCIVDGLLKHRRMSDGLRLIDEAISFSPQGLSRYYDAGLIRLKGELLSGAGQAGAKECFADALRLAETQGGKMLELRAAVSLSRGLAAAGEPGQARVLLSKVYGSFTEGFDCRHLTEARQLLEQLG